MALQLRPRGFGNTQHSAHKPISIYSKPVRDIALLLPALEQGYLTEYAWYSVAMGRRQYGTFAQAPSRLTLTMVASENITERVEF